jgi:hypothetical protein
VHYILHLSIYFFHTNIIKGRAFSCWILPFLYHFTTKNNKKNACQNHIFPPLRIVCKPIVWVLKLFSFGIQNEVAWIEMAQQICKHQVLVNSHSQFCIEIEWLKNFIELEVCRSDWPIISIGIGPIFCLISRQSESVELSIFPIVSNWLLRKYTL